MRSAVAWWALISVASGALVAALGGDALSGVGVALLVVLVTLTLVGWHAALRLSAQLEQLQAPLLDLTFDPEDASCHQQDWVDDASGRWLGAERYRVRLSNLSARTIDSVTLSIVRFAPQGAPFLPLPLKLVGDDIGVRSENIVLHGGETRYYEACWIGFDRSARPGEIVLPYARSGVPNMIPSGRTYRLELRAQGRDTAPAVRAFEVWVEDGRLQFAVAGDASDAVRASLQRAREQKLADVLTERRQLAIDILNRPLSSPALISAFKSATSAWTQNVLALLREHGCTPQQIASLEWLGDVPLGAYDPDPALNHLKSVHAEAIRRLERIIDAYSARPVFRT